MPITGGIGQGLDYNVDIVMCIDVTGSMSSIINEVKENALSLYQNFVAEMERKEKSVQQLRIKVIAFRDYGVDSEPMLESKFFVLDEERDEFYDFVNKLEAVGGGNAPESSLEALALAMKSDWVRTGSVRRHVILMYTDAPAIPLGTVDTSVVTNYPADMPASLAELHDLWESQTMEKRAKRLLVFAPDCDPWPEFATWGGNVFHTVSEAGKGCDDVDMDFCIRLLVNSI